MSKVSQVVNKVDNLSYKISTIERSKKLELPRVKGLISNLESAVYPNHHSYRPVFIIENCVITDSPTNIEVFHALVCSFIKNEDFNRIAKAGPTGLRQDYLDKYGFTYVVDRSWQLTVVGKITFMSVMVSKKKQQ